MKPNEEILERYLNGTASPEERKAVDTWYRELDFGQDLSTVTEDQELVWGYILQKTRKQVVPIYVRYAAAVLVLITLSIGVYLWRADVFSPVQYAVEDILPGGNKAVLHLNGKDSLVLTTLKDGETKVIDNIRITKLSDGTISYELAGDPTEAAKWNTLSTPEGGEFEIILPDGSSVMLNAVSSLSFPTSFDSTVRLVRLEGEAYFDVSHNPDTPFIVENNDQRVTVLGTKFNVTSYTGAPTVTALLEGKVEVTNQHAKIILQPGEHVVNDGISLVHHQVTPASASSWKDNRLSFESEPLADIMRKIARWYAVDVQFEDSTLKQKRFTGSIEKDKSLQAVLEMLSMTDEVEFEIQERKLIIKK